MLDIGWQELFIISVLAIIVVGPRDLPQALRAVTAVVRKARSLAREFQNGVDEMIREAELDDVKRQVDKVRRLDFDDEVQKTVDPSGTLTENFDPADFAREIKERVEGPAPSKPQTTPSEPSPQATPTVPPAAEPADKSQSHP